MKILTTGSRHWRSWQLIEAWIAGLPEDTAIVVGDQRTYDSEKRIYYGADYLVAHYAVAYGLAPVHIYKADWTEFGKAAGPIRNEIMYAEHPDIDHVAAFLSVDPTTGKLYPSTGTNGCIRLGEKRGLPIERHYDADWKE